MHQEGSLNERLGAQKSAERENIGKSTNASHQRMDPGETADAYMADSGSGFSDRRLAQAPGIGGTSADEMQRYEQSPVDGALKSGAPEPNKKALYVGNLHPKVTENMLTEIFGVAGAVQSVKIIPDKHLQHNGLNYGFVEYEDTQAAETALQTLNARKIFESEIKVNWAYQGVQSKEDTSKHYHIFVGDLSNEVNDEILTKAFSAFDSTSEARVMWDMTTGRSRGYGFVSFRDRSDAEKAIASMNGEWLGSRAIRCNWANQKGQPSMSQASQSPQPALPGAGYVRPTYANAGALSYDVVVQQSPQWQSTVYVGNLSPYTNQNDLLSLFQNFGYVVEVRMQADRGYSFVKMDTHETAAVAICQLNGYPVHGRPIRCSWGKQDRPPAYETPYQSPNPQQYYPQYSGASVSQQPVAAHQAGYEYNQYHQPQYRAAYGQTYAAQRQFTQGNGFDSVPVQAPYAQAPGYDRQQSQYARPSSTASTSQYPPGQYTGYEQGMAGDAYALGRR